MAASTSFFKQTGTATFPSQATAAQTRLYLGSSATNPTVDLAGDPLSVGMLYTRTTDNKLFHYDGSAWIEASPAATGSLTDVVDDLTPQLGGDLQSNGSDIVMADDDKVILGTDSDTLIQHTSAQNTTYVQSDGLEVCNKAVPTSPWALHPAQPSQYRYIMLVVKNLRFGQVSWLQGMTSDTATVAGLSYPSSDGTNGQVLTTDGSGTLSLQDVPSTGASVGSAIAFAIAL